MPAPATAAPGQAGAPQSGGTVPFFFGSNLYVQKFATNSWQLGPTTQEFTLPVTAGGFLRGVRLQLRSTGGVGGVATQDNPWNVFQNITLENVNGAALMFPMGGFAYYAAQFFSRPWFGDPARRRDYAAGANPSGTLNVFPEIALTAGVLANTDARSQYRLRYTINTAANVLSGSITTPPTTVVTAYAEIWAQPDSADLHGNAIQPLPDGLNLQTLRRHQVMTLNPASSGNIFQLTNVGNELRLMLLIVRDSTGARVDYLSDPIRWTLDDRNLGVFSPDEVFSRMDDFYAELAGGGSQRPVGCYAFPLLANIATGPVGESWLATNNATYLAWESATIGTGVNLPGTVEIVTDEVVPVGAVPMSLESI